MVRRHHKALIEIIKKCVNTEDPFIGAEVGVGHGELSESLLSAFPLLTLHMVDAWDLLPPSPTLHVPVENVADAEEKARRRTDFADDRRVIHKTPSTEASSRITGQTLGFVFIDACHTYHSVKEDLWCWYPAVTVGGLFSGHDYGRRGELKNPPSEDGIGVKRAVDEFAARFNYSVSETKETVWWWIK